MTANVILQYNKSNNASIFFVEPIFKKLSHDKKKN
jgi:hypothetical protein